jgi:hypothetical protein
MIRAVSNAYAHANRRTGRGSTEPSPGTPGADAEHAVGHSDQELERLIAQAQRYEPFTAQFFREAGIAPACGCSTWAPYAVQIYPGGGGCQV